MPDKIINFKNYYKISLIQRDLTKAQFLFVINLQDPKVQQEHK